MADFIGSYYECDDFDEETLGEQMDMMNSEQPVSVLDMESFRKQSKAVARQSAAACHLEPDEHKVCASAQGDCGAFQGLFSIEQKESMDDDLDIPVASMSTFDQTAPSMVTLQLNSFVTKDAKHGRQKKLCVPVEETPKTEQGDCSETASVGTEPLHLPVASNAPKRDRNVGERVLRKSLMKIWGRR